MDTVKYFIKYTRVNGFNMHRNRKQVEIFNKRENRDMVAEQMIKSGYCKNVIVGRARVAV